MKKNSYKIPIVLVSVLYCVPGLTDINPADDAELITELQQLHEAYNYVESASKIPQKEDQAPGVVTIVTEQEILNSGARDLIDVLRLVPGFDFGLDVENSVGPSIRGNWAYEGSILLMIDGLEMNERRYGTMQFGHHFPVDNIQKIEIIRGPGSVMYGSFAKLGVINIITKNANDKQGVSIVGRYGQMQRSNGHHNVSLYAGKKFTEDMQISASAKLGKAHRSDQIYHDIYGNSADLANSNQLEDLMFNVGFQYQKFSARVLIDQYTEKTRDKYIAIQDPFARQFKNLAVDLKYQHDFTDALKLNLKFNYYNQSPWVGKELVDAQMRYTSNMMIQRYIGDVHLDYSYADLFQVTGGIEIAHENFKNLAGSYDNQHAPSYDMQNLPTYQTVASYAEGLVKTPFGSLALGVRYDHHNVFQANLAHRVVFTDTLGDFHYKLLYNSSFRNPTIGNVAFNASGVLKPERTKSYELELGYQLAKNLSFKTNAFYLSSKNRFIYGIDPNYTNTSANAYLYQYYNSSAKIDTVGVESELRWKQNWGYLTFNHSYSQMINNFKGYQPVNKLTNSVVDSDVSLAFPAHKFSLNSHIDLTRSLSVNPSMTLSTSRYGYNAVDSQGNLLLRKYGPEVLGNIYFRYKDVLIKDLELGFGVYDLFGAKHKFIQPYDSEHAPLPDRSREFIFKISYQL